MSASPRPVRRVEDERLRSAAPTRSVYPSVPIASPTTYTNGSYLNPENSELYRNRRSATPKLSESIPLIDNDHNNKPPLANPEMDDSDDREVVTGPQPGVDDGFFSNRANEDGPTITDAENAPPASIAPTVSESDDVDSGRVRPKGVIPFYRGPLSPTNTNVPNMFPELENGTIPDVLIAESIPDVNVYQHKKTLAQGMMDLALFSANANQLRYVLDSDTHPYYYSGIVLIAISLFFQVAIGVGLIWNSRYNVKDEKEICIANKINNFTVIGIFLVTVINVFISAFGVASVQTIVPAQP